MHTIYFNMHPRKLLKFRSIAYVVLIVSLLIFVVSLYFYLLGPDERINSLNENDEKEFLLTPSGNETVWLSPFKNEMLIEYYSSNLFDFLINRSITIELKTDQGKVNFYVMNSTQFECWKNDSILCGEFFEEQVESVQRTFVLKNVWHSYHLVLLNMNNVTMKVNVKASEEFSVKVMNYERPFTFLKMAFISAIPLFLLQPPLRVTLDDIARRIEEKVITKRYRVYASAERKGIRGFYVINILIGLLCLVTSIAVSSIADRFAFVNQIWKDYFYRFTLNLFLLSIFLCAFLAIVLIFWGFFYWPLTIKLYKNQEAYMKHTETHLKILKKLLVRPFSIIFYICWFCLLCLLLWVTELEFTYFMSISLSIFVVYIGYNVSLAYFKTQQLVTTDFLGDFRHLKATLGSTVIISIIAVYGIKAIIPLLDMVSRYIIDKSILVSVAHVYAISTSRDVADFFNYITPYSAYIIPSAMLILYYSFVLISTLYLPKVFKDIDVPKIIIRDLQFEILFLFVIFSLSLWFKSLFTTINLQEVPLSLNISFITTLFRSYLETIRAAS